MEWWQAAVLGLVEGITEYLPVSSTGHLLLAQQAMGLQGEGSAAKTAADAYAICIQAGAILAVLALYRSRCSEVVAGVLGRSVPGRRLALHLLIAFAPSAGAAWLLEEPLQRELFGLWPVVGAWLVGGVALLAFAGRRALPEAGAGLDALSWRRALAIGVIQCLALWPGTSRSLVTILGGLGVGLSAVAAAEFSFLLGVATLSAATGYAGSKYGAVMLEHYTAESMAIGFLCALVAALAAVRWLIAYLQNHSLAIFGYYRIALALLVAFLIWRGLLDSTRG